MANRMKLDEARVREMRALRAVGCSLADISVAYGVSQVTAASVVRGRTWAGVPRGADEVLEGVALLLGPRRDMMTDRERMLVSTLESMLTGGVS